MNLYKLTNIMNNDYDTFDEIIVAANSPEDARQLIPASNSYTGNSVAVFNQNDKTQQSKLAREWTTPENVVVEFVGQSDKTFFKNHNNNPLILASFNAG